MHSHTWVFGLEKCLNQRHTNKAYINKRDTAQKTFD